MAPQLRRTPVVVRSVLLGTLCLALSACGVIGEDGEADPPRGPVRAAAAVDVLTGTTTSIKLDASFTAALADLGLTAAPTGRAKLTDRGVLVLPITGGGVSLFTKGEVSPYVVGIVFHDGSGLSLTNPRAAVRLTDLIVDPAFSHVYGDVSVNDKPFASKVVLFELDGRTLDEPDIDGRSVTLEGTRVTLSQVAADALGEVFRTTAVEPGLLVGVAQIKTQLPPRG